MDDQSSESGEPCVADAYLHDDTGVGSTVPEVYRA